jgi:hypothetical protein
LLVEGIIYSSSIVGMTEKEGEKAEAHDKNIKRSHRIKNHFVPF